MYQSVMPNLVAVFAATQYAMSLPLDNLQNHDLSPPLDTSAAPSTTPTSSIPNLVAAVSRAPSSPTAPLHRFLRPSSLQNIHPQAGEHYGAIVAFAVAGGLFVIVIIYALARSLWNWYHRPAPPDATDEADDQGMDIDELARELRLYTADSLLWNDCRARAGIVTPEGVNRIGSGSPPPPPYGVGECVPTYDESQRRHHGRFLGYVPVLVVSDGRGGESPRTPRHGPIDGYTPHNTI